MSPLRRQLLGHLREPTSASQLAAALDLSRQRVNYHLRALESAGLVELVEERQRRGFVERILRAKPGAFVVDPSVMGRGSESAENAGRIQDQFAAGHLVGVAAATVRDVARMQVKADEQGKRLLTFTIEAAVRFADAADVHRFTEELSEALRRTAEGFDSPTGRHYRVIIGGHPAPAAATDPTEQEQSNE
nr:helix-turn-helix domain-containing protein [Nocardioides panzhihuensis]